MMRSVTKAMPIQFIHARTQGGFEGVRSNPPFSVVATGSFLMNTLNNRQLASITRQLVL